MLDILSQTKANLITPEEASLDRTVYQITKVATMQVSKTTLEVLSGTWGLSTCVNSIAFDLITLGTLICKLLPKIPSIFQGIFTKPGKKLANSILTHLGELK